MRSSLQLLLLLATLLVVAALVGSFIVGLGGGVPAGSSSTAGAAPRARVEVLNGTKRSGLARSATDRLRDLGFDVVYYGNGPRADSTVVLDRVGRPEAARAVAAALGVGTVQSRPDPGLFLDATVILGPDWPPHDGGRQAAVGWWARLKRWLRRSERRRPHRPAPTG